MQRAGSVEVVVGANLSRLNRDLRAAESAVRKFDSTARDVFGRTSNAAQGLTSATASGSAAYRVFNGVVGGASATLGAFGLNLKLVSSLAAGFALYQVTKQFAEFEYNMNTVRAVLQTTGTEFSALDEKAQELGRNTRYSADQVAEAMSLMAKAGLNAGQVYGGVASTLNLAAVEGMDLAASTEAVVNIMTGMGLQVKDLDRAIDVLTKTSIDSTTSVSELAFAFRYASGTANTAGFSIEEVAAAFGLMAQAGVKGSMAGTSLAGIINRLIGPSKEAQKVMKAYGVEVIDTAGKLKPLTQILRELEPLTRRGARGLADLYTIFGVRPFQGISALLKGGADSLAEFQSRLDSVGGTSKRVSETQLEGLKGAFIELGNSAKGLAIAIGESGLGKAFESMADSAASAFRTMTEGLKSMKPLQEQALNTLRDTLATQQEQLDQVDAAIQRMRDTNRPAGMIAPLEAGRQKMLENIAVTEEFIRSTVRAREAINNAPAVKTRETVGDIEPPPPIDIAGMEAKQKAAEGALRRLQKEFLQATHQNRLLIETEQKNELADFQKLLDEKLITQQQYEEARRQLEVVTQKKLEDVRMQELKYFMDIGQTISSSLEGALRDFVKTGKVDFHELTNSILADIAVMTLRMAVLAPLFGGTGFGGQNYSGGGAFGNIVSSIFHAGGTVGMGSGVRRQVPAGIFLGAPRMHNGGRVLGRDEVPAILQRGERVLKRGDSGNGVVIQIVNNSKAEMRQETDQTSDGRFIQRLIFEEVNRGMLQGKFDGSQRQRFGNQVVGTRR